MNVEAEARRRVRLLLKKLRNRPYMETVTRSRSHVLQINEEELWVEAKRRILRKTLIKAAAYVYYTRTCVRKDIQRFSKYTSFLFGCLIDMFKDISRVKETKSGYRLTLLGIRVWLSGTQPHGRDLAIASNRGAKWVMFNWAYLRRDKAENWRRHRLENQMNQVFHVFLTRSVSDSV